MAFLVHFQHHDPDHIAYFHGLTGVLELTLAHLRNVDQSVLMDANIHKHAEVNDISYCAGQNHTGFQILDLQHILAENGRRQLITGISAGFAQLLGNVDECRLTDAAVLGGLGAAVFLQLSGQGRQIAALGAVQQRQQLLGGLIGLRMDTGIVQQLLAFRNPKEAGTLLKSLGTQLGNLF